MSFDTGLQQGKVSFNRPTRVCPSHVVRNDSKNEGLHQMRRQRAVGCLLAAQQGVVYFSKTVQQEGCKSSVVQNKKFYDKIKKHDSKISYLRISRPELSIDDTKSCTPLPLMFQEILDFKVD